MTPRVVFPGYSLDRGYPEGYTADDARHFETSRFARIPSISCLRLRRVSVVGTTLLRGFRTLDEYCRSRAARPWTAAQKARTYAKRLLLPVRRVPAASWALDHWGIGYFHWLLDVLPRLFAARACSREAPLLLPEHYTSREYVLESLRLLGQPFLTFSTRERVAVRDLFVATYPRGCDFNAPSVQRVREWFREIDGAPSARDAPWRIYVSRRKTRRRRVLNEPEVERVLRGRGFESVVFEDLSFSDQRAMMYGATHLVSNHGAGLANMLFMSPGSRVLELKSDSQNVNNCFFHLADALGHRYWYSMSPGDDPDVQRANVTVDARDLHRKLDAFLA